VAPLPPGPQAARRSPTLCFGHLPVSDQLTIIWPRGPRRVRSSVADLPGTARPPTHDRDARIPAARPWAAPLSSRAVWRALRPVLAVAYRQVRLTVALVLHPLRREIAEQRIRFHSPWDRVLVLCHGNICRSPYAATVLTQVLAERRLTLPVTQGGFIGPGRRSPATARAVAQGTGVNLRAHRSRLVTPEDVAGKTLVIVMEARQERRVLEEFGVPRAHVLVLGDLDPGLIPSRDIRDPWQLSPEVFEEVYRRLWRCTVALANCLRRGVATTRVTELSESAPGPRDDAPQVGMLQG
jgi:protein-tyrosine-phosphatase